MRFRILSIFCCCLAIICVAGCSSLGNGLNGKPVPKMTFEHLPPIAINVGALNTQSMVTGQEDLFVISPYDLMEAYLHTRFMPEGRAGTLLVTIEDSGVGYTHERAKNKLGEYFDMGGLDIYDMRIALRVDRLDDARNVVQTYKVNGQRIIKISEHSSIVEREQEQLRALEKLFYDLDGYMRKVILDDMGLGMTQ